MSSSRPERRKQPQASQVAWASIGVNVVLSLLNLAIAAASGSLAVAAEMVHNLVDLVASVAVLAGVKIAERESRAFPYGLYKVENVVAVGVAILIFFTGYEIAREALRADVGPATVNGWILAGVALSAFLPLAFSRYEMRMGREINSPSLLADAQEYRVHVFSSGVVFWRWSATWLACRWTAMQRWSSSCSSPRPVGSCCPMGCGCCWMHRSMSRPWSRCGPSSRPSQR
jgi:cation diffusion facilitator family transporter